MNVSLAEHNLGGLRWIVLHGPDREAFRALGEHARDEIAALTEAWPLLARLRQHVCDPPGSDRLNTVGQVERVEFPGDVWAELRRVAAGAVGAVRGSGRGLQRSARTLDAAIDYLRANP